MGKNLNNSKVYVGNLWKTRENENNHLKKLITVAREKLNQYQLASEENKRQIVILEEVRVRSKKVEEENKELKKQLKDLQEKYSCCQTELNAALTSTKQFAKYTEDSRTQITNINKQLEDLNILFQHS